MILGDRNQVSVVCFAFLEGGEGGVFTFVFELLCHDGHIASGSTYANPQAS